MTDTTTLTTPPETGAADRTTPVSGIFETGQNGGGVIRVTGYLPGAADVQVAQRDVRRLGLRRGDVVTGAARAGGRQGALVRVDTVNGGEPGAQRPRFEDLTPLYPQTRLRLETSPELLTTRVIDLLTPVGKGQRGLIVAPPKAGKTTVLKELAHAVELNHPEAHLMVVLLDERPEEVTDMRRFAGPRTEVLASTFDRPAKDHTALADLAVERAKRLVELGHDVVIVLDSLTRLCRAYNNSAGPGGRTLSGGVDAGAVRHPKRIFGAARNTEEAGSLTILASVLVETGSRGDEYFFEELKSTGNMELRLDRHLAEKRVFPAVDVVPSGTRREELLLGQGELAVVHKLRRVLHERDAVAAMELLRDRMRQTATNAEFLRKIDLTTAA
ncbi:Transcription termination factor Rho [Streptomyces sp. RB5]|uniref:Transcription termination factor Rho n=1 Tax=Streptomyces smaragdinus TaxID=2585196 RepID=A0A7K0CL87_9ACTN|nr:Transcription termination factor Rho [Streptomyces smaragdinus]